MILSIHFLVESITLRWESYRCSNRNSRLLERLEGIWKVDMEGVIRADNQIV